MLSDEFYQEAEKDYLNAVLICDRMGCIDWVNYYFSKMSGYMREDVIGDHIENILRGPDTKSYSIYKLHHGILRGAGINKLPLTYYKKNQSPYEVSLTAIPVLNSETKDVDQFIVYQREANLSGWKKNKLLRKLEAWLRRPKNASAPNWSPMETQIIPLDAQTGLPIDPSRNAAILETESCIQQKQ